MITIAERPAKLPAFGAGSDVRSRFTFRHRGSLGSLLLIPPAVAVLASKPMLAENSASGLALDAAGWMFFFLYAGVRICATLFVGGKKDRELQTEGPYSLCRNPLYVGSLCFAVAVALFLKSVVFGVALMLACLAYLRFVVRAEEHFLELRFQEDYRNYCRRTPRFWPRWAAFHSPPFVQVELKRLRKEAARLGGAALIVILLQIAIQTRSQPWWPQWFKLW
jgi:protein-S-isoprenylcysteine O-methyltransferase Ste14